MYFGHFGPEEEYRLQDYNSWSWRGISTMSYGPEADIISSGPWGMVVKQKFAFKTKSHGYEADIAI